MSTAERRRGSLAGSDPASERDQGFRAVGLAVSKLAAPLVAKRGGGVLVRLKANWTAIVGPEWALVAWPMGLGPGGVLKLCTRPAAALETQHRAPLLIERINRYFGRPLVTRLVLVQGTFPLEPEPQGPAPRSAIGGDREAFDARFAGIADPGLRAALARLARAVTDSGG
jgi:hypothetical protein